ncbi:hypothetical protein [Streptomyces sp. NPDC050738]|uniref:hypothetical protein n=1 Tax=Streptomyces sp. NPDC050738 TaxID=3154744 RepID=UPI00342989AF
MINWKTDIYPGTTTLAAYPHGGAKRLFDDIGHGQQRFIDTVIVQVGDTIATFNMMDVGRQTPFPLYLLVRQADRLAAAQR